MAFGEDSKTHTPWPEMFVEITVPEQKPVGGAIFPAIVGPRPCLAPDLSTVEHTVADPSSKAWLESLLHTSGAVLLRGFPITNASEFNRLVEAFGYQDFPYMGAALRTKIGGRVYTANESPLEEKIYFHQEMALVLHVLGSLCLFGLIVLMLMALIVTVSWRSIRPSVSSTARWSRRVEGRLRSFLAVVFTRR